MLFIYWMAWMVSVTGPTSFEEVDRRAEARAHVERSARNTPLKPEESVRALQARLADLRL